MTIQTLIFAEGVTPSEARRWAHAHGFESRGADTSGPRVRIRQRDPDDFRSSSFRTITLTDGVQAVVGQPRRKRAPLRGNPARGNPLHNVAVPVGSGLFISPFLG